MELYNARERHLLNGIADLVLVGEALAEIERPTEQQRYSLTRIKRALRALLHDADEHAETLEGWYRIMWRSAVRSAQIGKHMGEDCGNVTIDVTLSDPSGPRAGDDLTLWAKG